VKLREKGARNKCSLWEKIPTRLGKGEKSLNEGGAQKNICSEMGGKKLIIKEIKSTERNQGSEGHKKSSRIDGGKNQPRHKRVVLRNKNKGKGI